MVIAWTVVVSYLSLETKDILVESGWVDSTLSEGDSAVYWADGNPDFCQIYAPVFDFNFSTGYNVRMLTSNVINLTWCDLIKNFKRT